MMKEVIRLKGLLVPMDWHRNGRVKTVVLATDDENEIFIHNPLQNHIMAHLRQRVELWGTFDDSQHPTVFQVNRLRPWRQNG